MKKCFFKRTMSVILVTALLFSALVIPDTGKEVKAAIKISAAKKTLIVGQSIKLKVTGTKKQIIWSSSKKSVAKVSKKGKVKALKKGTAVIRAKAGAKTVKCKIKVESPVLNKQQVWTVPGEKIKLTLTGNTQSVQWSSENENIATVENGVLTAVAKGNTTIYAAVGKKIYKCRVQVADESMKETVENVTEVFRIINEVRTANGVKALEYDYNLCMAAMKRSEELAIRFDHIRPDNSSCFTVLKDYGYKVFSSRGENIAYGYTTPKKVVDGWMASAGHRGRILDADYEKTGIGYYFDETTETCYWCQIFYTK